MKPETIQTYRSPRWIALYISLAMMAVGWFAGHDFDYLSRRLPPSDPPNMFDGRFDPETFLCIILFFAGMFLCVVCCLWILIGAVISIFRQKHPKQV
jgi:hypothetical protein